MCIFIAGVQPSTVTLSEKPEPCPVCGLAQAYYKRIDQHISLFFIPVFRIRKGEPFLMCERCERAIQEMGPEYDACIKNADTNCPKCERAIHPEFQYCPHCGHKI